VNEICRHSTFIKAASSIFSCVGDSVQNYGLLESVGNWDIYESKVLGRKQFINRMSKKKTCNMPQEVLSLFGCQISSLE